VDELQQHERRLLAGELERRPRRAPQQPLGQRGERGGRGLLLDQGLELAEVVGLRGRLRAATDAAEHGGARLERAAAGVRLRVGRRRLALGSRLVHERDGEAYRLGRRLHLELGLLDVRGVHRAVLEPCHAEQQQGQPLLLRGGPGRRHQLRLRAVRRVGGVVQRLS